MPEDDYKLRDSKGLTGGVTELRRIVAQLDIPVRQVMIEARTEAVLNEDAATLRPPCQTLGL